MGVFGIVALLYPTRASSGRTDAPLLLRSSLLTDFRFHLYGSCGCKLRYGSWMLGFEGLDQFPGGFLADIAQNENLSISDDLYFLHPSPFSQHLDHRGNRLEETGEQVFIGSDRRTDDGDEQ